jgi:hypothetical protein
MTDDTTSLLRALGEASRDLLFPSESDFPIEACTYGPEAPSPEGLLRARGKDPATPVEEASFASFFEGLDDERFTALASLLERELADLRLYRIGKTDIELVLLGRHPSGVWLGVTTRAVET